MTLGSCLMVGIQGFNLTKKEKDFIITNQISGVVLFKRNLQSFQQIYELCSEIKSLTSPSPLIAIDMEGGEVNRFSHLKESLPWPSPKVLKTLSSKQIFLIAKSMATQLHLLGININFAPVVDLLLTDNPLLNNRVFGQSKKEILQSTSPFIEGIIAGKLIPCLKHFPGHGGVKEDSHKTLPKDNRSLIDLKNQLDIFQGLFKKYSCWIMTAHIEFPNIDKKKPATFSKKILTKLLREQGDFKELVISDDIDMEALEAFSSGERFFHALKGGCDLILTGQKEDTAKEIINYFQQNPEQKRSLEKELEISSKRILIQKKISFELLPRFEMVKEELLKIQSKELLSIFSLIQ